MGRKVSKGAFKYYISTFGGEVWAKMLTLLWGSGGLSQNDDMLTLWRDKVWELKHKSKYCCKILDFINKLMNFFLNHALTILNTAPTPQNSSMIIEKHILIIWNVFYTSSSNSPSVQVLHQQIRSGWGVKTCADLADTRGVLIYGKPADVVLECFLTQYRSTVNGF